MSQILFASADETMAPLLDQQKFEESLLYNVLFQERIIMHDTYYFNSSFLRKHIDKDEPSLFERCCGAGLIRPTFRDKKIESIHEAYEDLKVTFPTYIPPDAGKLKRMMAWVDLGLKESGTKPLYWPGDDGSESVGDGFERIIRSFFYLDKAPRFSFDGDKEKALLDRELVWEQTKEWRIECLDDACRQTTVNGGKGLKRSEYFASILRSLKRHEFIDDVGEFIGDVSLQRLPKYLSSRGFEKQSAALSTYWLWINRCHHINIADKFKAGINFINYGNDSDFLAEALFTSKETPKEKASFEILEIDIKLPLMKNLSRADEKEIIAIRSDLGAEYLDSLRKSRESDIRDSLTGYCKALSSRVKKSVSAKIGVIWNKRVEYFSKVANLTGTLIAGSDPNIGLGIYVSAEGLSTIIYPVVREYVAGKSKTTRLEVVVRRDNTGV